MRTYKYAPGNEMVHMYDDETDNSLWMPTSEPEIRRAIADGLVQEADPIPPNPDDEIRRTYLQMAEEASGDAGLQIYLELYRFDRGLLE